MRPYERPGYPGWWSEHWRTNERWTDDRIERDLREFIGARDEWPAQSEFYWRGRRRLLHAVYQHGGSIAWARRLGIRTCRRLV
jgi:hypothetical protein